MVPEQRLELPHLEMNSSITQYRGHDLPMQPDSASEPVVLYSMNNDADAERLNAKISRSSFDVARPRKLRRVTRACDFCHRRSTRCKQSQESQDDSRCQNCLDFDIACTFERPARKRGSKRQRQAQVDEDGSPSGEHANLLLQMINSHVDDGEAYSYGKTDRGTVETFTFPLATEYRDMVLGNPDIIQDLVSVYFEVVYPMYVINSSACSLLCFTWKLSS